MSFNDMVNSNSPFLYNHAGDMVEYNGFQSKGHLFYEPTETLQMNSKQYAVNDNTLTLTLATGSIGTITNNTGIKVKGIKYQINKYLPLSDGNDTKLWLSEVH